MLGVVEKIVGLVFLNDIPFVHKDTIKSTIGIHGRHSGLERIIDGLNKAELMME